MLGPDRPQARFVRDLANEPAISRLWGIGGEMAVEKG